MADPSRFELEAEVVLRAGADPAAVGAAVTVAVCGHWDHEGPCRWPHHSEIDAEREPARFRTVFAADQAEAPEVRERIEAALRGDPAWRVVSISPRG